MDRTHSQPFGPPDKVWTVADYEQLPEDGTRYEILDGELIVMSSPDTAHQSIAKRLYYILYRAIDLAGRGEAFFAPFDVELDFTNLLEPDLIVILAEHLERLTPKRVVGPPDVVVEILSPSTSTRDRTRKLKIYERFGVTNYWIVDPKRRTLSEYVLTGKSYRLAATLREADVFQPAAVPSLDIAMAEIFNPPAR